MAFTIYKYGEVMERGHDHASTDEEPGHENEFAIDWNLLTYGQLDVESTIGNLSVDFQSAQEVDGCALWIHNFANNWRQNSLTRHGVAYSDNGSSYTPWLADTLPPDVTGTQPFNIIYDPGSSQTHRYFVYRYGFTGAGTPPFVMQEIAALIFFKKTIINAGQLYPRHGGREWVNRVRKTRAGYTLAESMQGRVSRSERRDWELEVNQADYDEIENLFHDCRGRRFMFIGTDGSGVYVPFSLAGDGAKRITTDHGFKTITLSLIEEPSLYGSEPFL